MERIYYNWPDYNRRLTGDSGEQQGDVIVFSEDGFLPDGVISPFRYYVDKNSSEPGKGEPLFANLLTVPDYWEILMRYHDAQIWDEGFQKADIEYAEPVEYHNVKTVNWRRMDGSIYKSDHYDRFGKLFYTDMLTDSGEILARTYLADNKPVILHHPQTDFWTLLESGRVTGVFSSKKAFFRHFMQDAYPAQNVFSPETCNSDILILTDSDSIEKLETLVSSLPEFRFHICAKTLMSQKLNDLTRFANVSLYPTISEFTRNELLETCTYYLDINHYNEICEAVYEAHRHHLLILGFQETLHDKALVLPECVFPADHYEQMMRMLQRTYYHKAALKSMLEKQCQLHEK